MSLHDVKAAGGTMKHADADGEALKIAASKQMNDTNMVAMEQFPNRKTETLSRAGLRRPQKYTGKEVVLQALAGTNQALAKASIAFHQCLLMRRKRNLSSTHPVHTQEACPEVDDDTNSLVDWKLSLINISYGKPNIATIEQVSPKHQFFALAICGDLLYTALGSKDIRVFRAPMFEELDCFGGGSGPVQSLMAFEEYVYSAHQDNKIRVWKRLNITGDGRCKHKLVTVLPRLEHCVKSMLSKGNYVQVRRHKRKLWIEHADRISALALGGGRIGNKGCNGGCISQPSVLYSASWDRTVKVWGLNNFKCMESFYAHHDAINAMVVIDGSILVTASADGTIKLWAKASYPTRKKKHALVSTLEGHNAAVNALAISANGKVLYSGGSDGALIVWKKVYRGKAQARARITAGISVSSSGEIVEQSGKGKIISTASSLETQNTSGLIERSVYAVVSRNLSGELSTSGGEEMQMSSAESPMRRGLSSLKKGFDHHSRSQFPFSTASINFVRKTTLSGHTRSVLSVSTVGDNIVCSSSADKTIRVWVRGRERRRWWDYSCAAVLAGHGSAVKAIASVSPRTPDSCSSGSANPHAAGATAASGRLITTRQDELQGVIVYSGGLDSKVKVWALNIPS